VPTHALVLVSIDVDVIQENGGVINAVPDIRSVELNPQSLTAHCEMSICVGLANLSCKPRLGRKPTSAGVTEPHKSSTCRSKTVWQVSPPV